MRRAERSSTPATAALTVAQVKVEETRSIKNAIACDTIERFEEHADRRCDLVTLVRSRFCGHAIARGGLRSGAAIVGSDAAGKVTLGTPDRSATVTGLCTFKFRRPLHQSACLLRD